VHRLTSFWRVLVTFEMGQQRTWDHIPKRNCMWDTKLKNLSVGGVRPASGILFQPVETHYTCQVTNQSSHGELSFHHNPHLRPSWSLCLSTFRVIRRGGTRLKNAALLTYCHCCELCAIKQKPGVLLEQTFRSFLSKQQNFSQNTLPNPNCRPYSSPHQVPKH
jgi:hypothetical protein